MPDPDFSKIIRSLERNGLTQREIAFRLNTTQPTVNRIKNKHQIPNYFLGKKILSL